MQYSWISLLKAGRELSENSVKKIYIFDENIRLRFIQHLENLSYLLPIKYTKTGDAILIEQYCIIASEVFYFASDIDLEKRNPLLVYGDFEYQEVTNHDNKVLEKIKQNYIPEQNHLSLVVDNFKVVAWFFSKNNPKLLKFGILF